MSNYLTNLKRKIDQLNPYYGKFNNWRVLGGYALSPDKRSEIWIGDRFKNFHDEEGSLLKNIKSAREKRLIRRELMRLQKAAMKTQERSEIIELISKYNNIQDVEF